LSEKAGKKQRPLPLNTVELLKTASTRLSMGPQETMRIAENLYIFSIRQL
jgi:DNA topoisomerase IA